MNQIAVAGATGLLLKSLLAAGSAAAQEANQVFLGATYLGAPTDWCPADAGVPLVVEMDGPDIVEGPKAWPRTVKVSKGGNVSEFVVGEHVESFQRPEDFEGTNAQVIGRFSAELRTCHSPWSFGRASGNWRLIGKDGADMESGTSENSDISLLGIPLFSRVPGGSEAHYAKFGDLQFFTANGPEITITQTFAAEPDKE